MYLGIDLRLQYCAVIVAKELNFTRASDFLHVAQPALSRSIRQLESLLGVRLFERNSRRVALTPAGERFVAEARRALFHAGRAVELARTDRNTDRLVIGYPAHFDARLVTQLSRLQVPGIQIREFAYRSMSTTEIVDSIRTKKIDCGLISLPEEYQEILDFPAPTLSQHQLGILIPREHPLARKRNLELHDLKTERLIFIPQKQDPALAAWVERCCRAAGFTPNIAHEVSHPHDYATLVLHGLGIGLGFDFKSFTKDISQKLVARTLCSAQLQIKTAVMFTDKFHFKPLSAYVSAVTKLREKRERNTAALAFSA